MKMVIFDDSIDALSQWKENITDLSYAYQEPTLVPLGEKPQVSGNNLTKGTQQISPKSSV